MNNTARTDAAANPFIYGFCRMVFAVLFRIYFRLRVSGAHEVPSTGPVILASNHASFVDPPVVGVATPRACHYLARSTLFDHLLLGWWLRAVGVAPVDRERGSAAGLKALLGCLERGGVVLLFPEGTRTPDGRLQPARSGIGLMALKSGAPVVPVRLRGSFEAWGRHHRLPRPRRITVRFGPALRFEGPLARARTCSKEELKDLYQEVSEEIMAAIAAL
jgi:1-acyl-sn-glycerol-3-phosphate acyltransferase